MDTNGTRTLWEKGEDAWNAWALEVLQRKEALEQDGEWLTDWFGEGQNNATQAWLAETKADFAGMEFSTDTSFENFVFPGLAMFEGAHFLGKANFTAVHFVHVARFKGAHFDGDATLKQVKFYHLADFDDAAFASAAEFERAEFQRDSTGPLVHAARFHKTRFGGRVEFRSATFAGHAEFVRAQFGNNARFDEAEFAAEANFEGVTVEGTAGLVKTRFLGAAKFNGAHFRGEARIGEASFFKSASFENAKFDAKTYFRFAQWNSDTTFRGASFADEVRFSDAKFGGTIIFQNAQFANEADFRAVNFSKAADFRDIHFNGDAHFEKAVFAESADFPGVKFEGTAAFAEATFQGSANFLQSSFKAAASFRHAVFKGPAAFAAIQSQGAFVLAGCAFEQVPSLHESSFRQPPHLDHMTIADPLLLAPDWKGDTARDPRPRALRRMKVCASPEFAPHYRRLRQLAASTQDFDRAQEYFAQEIRCRRFWHDRPLTRGRSKFWLGWAYGGVSDFGRSLMRPALTWVVNILVFTLIYLGQRSAHHFTSAPGPIQGAAPIFPVWPDDPGVWTVLQWVSGLCWWLVLSFFNLFSGGGCIAGEGGATAEAFFLSLKNSLFFLAWENPDASRRVYSCLYGFETQGGAQVLRVPLSVSTAAIAENIIGATLIVLFLLGLRNVLRAR